MSCGAAPWPLPFIPMKSVAIQGSYVGSLPGLRDLEAGRIVGRMIMTP